MNKEEIKFVMQWCLSVDTTPKKLNYLSDVFINEHKEAINYTDSSLQLIAFSKYLIKEVTQEGHEKVVIDFLNKYNSK